MIYGSMYEVIFEIYVVAVPGRVDLEECSFD